jgi:hypothetical protein
MRRCFWSGGSRKLSAPRTGAGVKPPEQGGRGDLHIWERYEKYISQHRRWSRLDEMQRDVDELRSGVETVADKSMSNESKLWS